MLHRVAKAEAKRKELDVRPCSPTDLYDFAACHTWRLDEGLMISLDKAGSMGIECFPWPSRVRGQ
eukprot:5246361-Alexandrium_andersonii.AAC.1